MCTRYPNRAPRPDEKECARQTIPTQGFCTGRKASVVHATTMGHRIRDAREARGLDQKQLGKAVGVGRNAVSAWENDTSVPEGRYIPALLESLDVDANWLFTGSYRDGVAIPSRATLEELRQWLDRVLPPREASSDPVGDEKKRRVLDEVVGPRRAEAPRQKRRRPGQ